jgi:hypothetical protein
MEVAVPEVPFGSDFPHHLDLRHAKKRNVSRRSILKAIFPTTIPTTHDKK